jgi:hypothetical protein
MSDENADRNNRLKATMRQQNSDNLNKSGRAGVVVKSPKQGHSDQPSCHIDVGTGKRPVR